MSIVITEQDLEKFVPELFWLAWKASLVVGMGALQDNPSAVKGAVLSQVGGFRGCDNYSADYVFGRMMKLRFSASMTRDGLVRVDLGQEPREDYQSWCSTYKTNDDLILAAMYAAGI